MEFLVLGPLEVHAAGEALVLRGGRPRTLLHALILNRRVVQPVEVLADRLWDDEPPLDGPNAVHQLVSYLRRALGSQARDMLLTTPGGYRLDVEDTAVDAWRLEQLVRSAFAKVAARTTTEVRDGLREATEAVQLWRGEPFAESAGFDWTSGARARLHDAYLQAQETRLNGMLVLGQDREVVLEAQSLTAAYPLRETFHAQLSLALYRSGRQSDALDVHRAVRELLASELALDPGAELKDLERAILNQDPSLDWVAPQDTVQLRGRSSAPTTGTSAVPGAGPDADVPTPHTLPPADHPMVGRDHDLAVALRRARPGTAYTITGPAGVGKSRFAHALAAALQTPVWRIDLSSVAGDHVAAALADGLDVHHLPGQEPAERVQAALGNADGLLLLDNCEHLVDDLAPLVADLRASASSVRLVTTSRRPLGLVGEVVHQLAPLPVPLGAADPVELGDNLAVQLFCDRAASRRAHFTPTPEQLHDIAHIVRTLDGLPLAIEIAAAHSDVLTTSMLRQRIDEHLDTLVTTGFALPSRSRSLSAAIDSSVVLLTDAERAFLCALSIFPGSFDGPAAAAVTGSDPDSAFQILTSLVRQSLVALDERYRLLSPVRSYVSARAAADIDLDTVRHRHARWLAATAWDIWEPPGELRQRRDLSELRTLLADARIALEHCLAEGHLAPATRIAVAFSWVWTLHGLAGEGARWLTRVKALSDGAPADDPDAALARATVLRSLGLLANPAGELERAKELCTEAVDLSLRHDDASGAAAAYLTLSVSHWALGDMEASSFAARRASELTSHAPGTWGYVAARVLGARAALDGDEPHAVQLLDEALEAAQAADEQHLFGLALACRARRMLHDGDVDEAALVADEALRAWRRIDYKEGEVMALNLLARTHVQREDHDAGNQAATEALHVAAAAGLRGAACESVESIAMASAAAGRREHALLLFEVAARERFRLRAPVPAADAPLVERTIEAASQALGSAATLVRARAKLTRFDALVDELRG